MVLPLPVSPVFHVALVTPPDRRVIVQPRVVPVEVHVSVVVYPASSRVGSAVKEVIVGGVPATGLTTMSAPQGALSPGVGLPDEV